MSVLVVTICNPQSLRETVRHCKVATKAYFKTFTPGPILLYCRQRDGVVGGEGFDSSYIIAFGNATEWAKNDAKLSKVQLSGGRNSMVVDLSCVSTIAVEMLSMKSQAALSSMRDSRISLKAFGSILRDVTSLGSLMFPGPELMDSTFDSLEPVKYTGISDETVQKLCQHSDRRFVAAMIQEAQLALIDKPRRAVVADRSGAGASSKGASSKSSAWRPAPSSASVDQAVPVASAPAALTQPSIEQTSMLQSGPLPPNTPPVRPSIPPPHFSATLYRGMPADTDTVHYSVPPPPVNSQMMVPAGQDCNDIGDMSALLGEELMDRVEEYYPLLVAKLGPRRAGLRGHRAARRVKREKQVLIMLLCQDGFRRDDAITAVERAYIERANAPNAGVVLRPNIAITNNYTVTGGTFTVNNNGVQ